MDMKYGEHGEDLERKKQKHEQNMEEISVCVGGWRGGVTQARNAATQFILGRGCIKSRK